MSVNMLSSKYIVWKDGMIASTEEIERILRNIAEIRGELVRLKDVEKQMQDQLYLMVGENEMVVDPHTGLELATWKYTKDSYQFDAPRFKEEQKSLYNEYLKPKAGHRVLKVKI